ncbi:MAG: hypothetical protein AAFX76_08010 [Planctomycetota bacterium]
MTGPNPPSDSADPAPTPTPLHPERMTWPVLLGRWVDFARSAVALPDNAAGRRWRASVADIIQLQAVWFALRQLDELDPAERALGVDRAGVLIERHAGALAARWPDGALPAEVAELVREARAAWRDARASAPGGGGPTA